MLGRAQHLHYDFDHFYVVCFVNSPQKIEVRKIRVFQAFASISKQFQIIHFFHFLRQLVGQSHGYEKKHPPAFTLTEKHHRPGTHSLWLDDYHTFQQLIFIYLGFVSVPPEI